MRTAVRWEGLRELMLFGFSDAASLEHKKELALSPCWQTQRRILERLDELFDEVGGAARLAIVAQSLGGTPREDFRRMRSLSRLLTTGCNIPVCVAGDASIEPIDRRKLDAGFRWINQFDPDDVLGWPLAQLSPYQALVQDHAVSASSGTLLGGIRSLTPYSHAQTGAPPACSTALQTR